MRLKLKLKTLNSDKIEINYNYPLSSAIYKLLQLSSPEFSDFLHEIGFKYATKTYKLFTFALRFSKFKIKDNCIILLDNKAELYISSPLINDFIQNFVIGSLEKQKIELDAQGIKTQFIIEQMETLPEPTFKKENKFIMYSPLVLSKNINHVNYTEQRFLRYYDSMEEINRIFNINLKNKYRLIFNEEYKGKDLILEWDKNYIEKMKKKNKRITKKITVSKLNEENRKIKIDIIGNQLPFELIGNPDLIEVGYSAGFGEKNSLGCGFAELIN